MKKIFSLLICLTVMGVVIATLQWKSSFADEEIVAQANENMVEQEISPMPASATAKPKMYPTKKAAYEAPVSIGRDDAPVTLMEYSSLSCPHCATFHRATLTSLKKDYVDTGKLRIVFNDFPLNKPALDGALLLHCIPADKRYDFMNLLFEQQAHWAFTSNPAQKLKQFAALVGVGGDKADACMNDKAMQNDMMHAMRLTTQSYQISSTPSFVVLPTNKVITGARSYGDFSAAIEAALKATEK